MHSTQTFACEMLCMQKLNQFPTSSDAFVWYLHLQNIYRKVEEISSVRVRLMRFCEMLDGFILAAAYENRNK